MSNTDFLIIGAGIVGISIAREIKTRYPDESVTILEKEPMPGLHSSGRNSGVLHSGIYYPSDSLKSKVCKQGALEMAAYHQEHGLPLDRRGKILVATNEVDAPQLRLLEERAAQNGIRADRIDEHALRLIEPEARSSTGEALWIPSTSVGSPKAVMNTLIEEIKRLGCDLRCGTIIEEVSTQKKHVRLQDGAILSYGHVINSSGLHADKIAHKFNCGMQYTLLPFKGIYWKLDPACGLSINHLIYPVPDLRVPFLGVHTTTTTDGSVYFGPTAVPAFGRENYSGIHGVTPTELIRITGLLSKQIIRGSDGFRRLAWQEGRRYFKSAFVDAAQAIVPRLKSEFLQPTDKVGIRAQMLDTQTGQLVTDFLVKRGPSSTHILNAISPAWTGAFPFARHICDHFLERIK